MSFSSDVKYEISALPNKLKHCNLAILSSVINSCSVVDVDMELNYFIKISIDNMFVYEKTYDIINKDFKYKPAITDKKSLPYKIVISDSETAKKILCTIGIFDKDSGKINFKIHPLITKSLCCKKAFIKYSFLTNGYISDPNKAYHLEFVFQRKKYADEFSCLMNYFELKSKVVPRKDSFVVYIKEGEQIVYLLNVMGAHKSLLKLEELRVEKEVSNNINRKVNFQSANLIKTISASVKQVEDIKFINNAKGLSFLPPELEEIARVRLEFPEITLKELGEKLTSPLGKSGVNHRLKRLSKIANIIKNKNMLNI